MDTGLGQAVLGVILEQGDLGIHMVDAQGVTRIYNALAAEMDGIEPGLVLGRHLLENFPSLTGHTSTLLQVLRTAKPLLNQQQTYRNLYGKEITSINSTLPVIGQEGRMLGAVEISRDVTRLQQLSEQIIELRRRLYLPRATQPRGKELYSFADIIGASGRLQEVLARGAKAALTDSPIIVHGETGTGKELLVQAIHNAGPRRDKPFVAQNCAALPAGLLEGILFGSLRGSFTGAENRPGLFELADGGTLFLDELNAMDYSLQAKLLRALEDGEIRRLGELEPRRVDVRIIAVMGENPQLAVERGVLRRDLWYRLNVVNLGLPPLRERLEDLPLLVQHFISRLNLRLGTRVTGISASALERLLAWPWPGNIRELANLLEGIFNNLSEGVVSEADLPPHLTARPCPIGLRAILAEKEEHYIHQALQAWAGNISAAAAALGLPRQTLQRKLKQYGWYKNC